jgi:hypothetical protein
MSGDVMTEQPEWLTTVTRLRRSKSGDTIHAKDCRRAGNTIPWLWAEGRERAQILSACEANGLRRCRVCDPLWEGGGPFVVHVTAPPSPQDQP